MTVAYITALGLEHKNKCSNELIYCKFLYIKRFEDHSTSLPNTLTVMNT